MTSLDACRDATRILEAHLDGQLDPVKTLEVEEHLSACEMCREKVALDRAIRSSLKKSVKTSAPEDVKARLLAAMAGEDARQVERAENAPDAKTERGMLRHWRTLLPLASAAALALAWGAASRQPMAHGLPSAVGASFGSDDLLHDFVAQHSRPLRPELTDPKLVRALERDVGVPVRVPRFQKDARFLGGRVVPVHGGERAAVLQYELTRGSGVQRVTVFVYDPRKIQVSGPNLAPRAVGTAEVRVGQTDGYSVAVRQQNGVGYAMTSELDPESSAELLAVVDPE